MNLAMHIKLITLSRGRVPMNNGARFRSEDVNGMKIERDVFTCFLANFFQEKERKRRAEIKNKLPVFMLQRCASQREIRGDEV